MPPTQQQTRRVLVVADVRGTPELKKMTDELGGINKNTKSLADSFAFLKTSATSFLGGLGIRQLAGFSDEIQSLSNRLVVLTGSQEAATKTLGELVQVSRDTNQSVDGTSQIYLKLSMALRAAHLNSGTLLEMSKNLINTYRLSGTSADDAASGVNSLALAFELGGLKGRELRTILRQNTVLAALFRKELGPQLFNDAQLGYITVAKFMEILHKNTSDLDDQAKKLNATFGQSTTKALDAVKLKVFELSDSMGASSKFAVGVQWGIDHMQQLSYIVEVAALVSLPLLIKQLFSLVSGLGLLNPYVLTFTALAGGLLLMNTEADKSLGPIDQVDAAMYRLDITAAGFLEKVSKMAGFKGIIASLIGRFIAPDVSDAKQLLDALELEAEDNKRIAEVLAQSNKEDLLSGFKAEQDKIKKAFHPDESAQKILADLNREFAAGRISVSEYNDALLRVDLRIVNKEFINGKKNLFQLNEEIRKNQINHFNQEYRDGVLTLTQFNTSIRGVQLAKLNEELAAGTISLSDYNSKLASVSDKYSTSGAFRTGLQDYLTSIGTTTQLVANSIKSAFSDLETHFLAFIKTGEFNFNKFAETILDDLLRIIIRASIIQPLAQGLLSYVSTPAATNGTAVSNNGYAGGKTGNANFNAHGNVYDMGLKKFASGGIVGSPTMFGYGNNKAGIMGEAGPEAIIPLKRGSGGDLGIKASLNPVTINIINQSGAEVSQKETTGPNGDKQIEILVTSKVREGFATGKYDKVMKQSYGLNRKGS